MANEAPGAFGYLWFQQKGTKGLLVFLLLAISWDLGARSEYLNFTLNIKHHSQADDLRACFEAPEWGVFCHLERLRNRPARLKLVSSESAALTAPPQWVIICGRYNYTLPASTGFDLMVPLRG